jgi:hypothetical protein
MAVNVSEGIPLPPPYSSQRSGAAGTLAKGLHTAACTQETLRWLHLRAAWILLFPTLPCGLHVDMQYVVLAALGGERGVHCWLAGFGAGITYWLCLVGRSMLPPP